ncbi:16S/23S rRNA (cytidine-2'-O)-methyltransferase TlyA [Ephemeroptericola cinctiostellae]|uniref:16S/23S rRNA (Cytidine-2'-O)-methyltransferase TlyA n=1 Tax=Ephemeroptericola cinctiostellae TaxID=2268024 RepID=A0A345DAV7_9BURK|nr:TlyA family RNA methyltransferase [Ephemeroptericola cinctiostellae]AXF85495.1 16S/23S rRNA (cytidine-2'-O)-methyltransferase TlyA [Ephemeroptericola cinctiostellae]
MPRIDHVLVTQGFAETRSHAQRLIADGRVSMNIGSDWQKISKPAYIVTDDALLEVAVSDTDKFVSRAGIKLAGALAHVDLDVAGFRCLDLGTSTGGFADCLLQAGAAQVVGVDVGHGQLHASLTHETRLTVFENTNARYLDSDVLDDAWSDYNADHESKHEAVSHSFDLAVADLSFISLTKVLPIFNMDSSSQTLLSNSAHVLALVKPQFELTADDLSKAGIVKDPAKYAEVQASILAACAAHDLTVLDYFASPITGTDGNHEFFVFAQYQAQALIDSK